MHASMGDGEICFTGVEIAGEVDIRFDLLKGKQATLAGDGARRPLAPPRHRLRLRGRAPARLARRRRSCSSTSTASRSRTRSSSSRSPATPASPRRASRRRASARSRASRSRRSTPARRRSASEDRATIRTWHRTMNAVHESSTCAVAACAEIIGAKWTALLVHDLSEGPRRFSQLERSCSGISPRTLAERLRALEHEGILERRSYPESPPRVEYELTEKGAARCCRSSTRCASSGTRGCRAATTTGTHCTLTFVELASAGLAERRVERGRRVDALLEVAHEELLVRRVHVRLGQPEAGEDRRDALVLRAPA